LGIDDTIIIVRAQAIAIYLANGRRKMISFNMIVVEKAKITPL